MEPPPSVPRASGPCPVATAAAAPPDEPPAVRERSHGFRVTPKSGLSVNGLWPNSGVVVLPMRMAPASRSRRTGTASSAGTWSAKISEPIVVRIALGEQQILDRERHAVERAERSARHQRRLGPAGGVPGLVRGHRDEGVHGRLERLDPTEHGVDHRDG